MKVYKVFDKNWSCQGYSFKKGKKVIGTIHKYDGKLVLCRSGFHFCRELANCFNWKSFDPKNKVAEIEILGDVVGEPEDKECTDSFKIVREIKWGEVLKLVNIGNNNTGHSNSGDSNSGHRNSGHRNSGHWNSGYSNSGDSNSGDWNSCNQEAGFFNSKDSGNIRVFNKICKKAEWENADKPNFIYDLILNEWIYWDNMTDEEKENDKEAYLRGGYLKTYSYKEAWQNAYGKATKEDIKLLKKLPNFNTEIFKEITGIKVK